MPKYPVMFKVYRKNIREPQQKVNIKILFKQGLKWTTTWHYNIYLKSFII